MKANVAENRARVVMAEAEVPKAMAEAFREGNFIGRAPEADGKRRTLNPPDKSG